MYDMRKQIFALFTSVLLLFTAGRVSINALEPYDVPADGRFHLVDYETDEIIEGDYETFVEAKAVYNTIKDDYINLGIVKDGVTYEAEYALSLFRTDDACRFEVEYTNTSDGTSGTVNGCYGVDAAYLYTDDNGEKVTFALSGVTAQASLEDVMVIPLQNIYVNLSMFTARNGDLYHMVKGEMNDDYFDYIIDLGPTPEYLEEGKAYYSYDGHYFYSDDRLYEMLDDFRNGIRDSSVNNEDPYYDWYQFVSHRTLTHADRDTLGNWLKNDMGLTSPIREYIDNDKDGIGDILNQSQLYGTEDAFFQFQYEFGVNALMSLAIARSESGSGRSSLSYTRNNLYSHAASDSETEAELGRYFDLRNSIASHAKYYMSGSYLSPMKEQYNGGFFGNLSAGINVRYSSDPYWGEKMAAAYRELDRELEAGDGYSTQIGIRTVENETVVYKDPSSESPIYMTGSMPDMAFVILDEIENDDGEWYQIQSDATLDENRSVDLSYYYRWNEDVAYIRKDAVQLLIGERAPKNEYVTVTFEGNGGQFVGGEEVVTYELPSGSDAVIAAPVRENGKFTGVDLDTSDVTADMVFTAQYRDVLNISMAALPETEYELNDRLSLKHGEVLINYTDSQYDIVPMSSSSVSGFDMSSDGEQIVTVSEAGCETSFTINVSAEKDEQRAATKEQILDLIAKYGSRDELFDYERDEIIAVKQQMDRTVQPYLTQPELRAFDSLLRTAYQDRIRYVIADNDLGFGISGLSASIPLEEGQLDKSTADVDTYRVSIEEGISEDAEARLTKEAEFLNETVRSVFHITLTRNMEETSVSGPLLCTVNRPSDSAGGDVFRVLTITEEGDIIDCYTRQTTNTISFITEGTGEFVLTCRNTSNQYIGEDPVETLTPDTASYDIRSIIARAALAAIILVAIIFAAMYLLNRYTRRKRVERHVVKRQKIQEETENLEVTQALEILNTEMIRLDEVKKAEEAERKKRRPRRK